MKTIQIKANIKGINLPSNLSYLLLKHKTNKFQNILPNNRMCESVLSIRYIILVPGFSPHINVFQLDKRFKPNTYVFELTVLYFKLSFDNLTVSPRYTFNLNFAIIKFAF